MPPAFVLMTYFVRGASVVLTRRAFDGPAGLEHKHVGAHRQRLCQHKDQRDGGDERFHGCLEPRKFRFAEGRVRIGAPSCIDSV